MSSNLTYQAVLASLLVELAEPARLEVTDVEMIEALVVSAADHLRISPAGERLNDPVQLALEKLEGLDWEGYPPAEVKAAIARASRLVSGPNFVLDPVL